MPVAESERIEIVDVVRGVAVLGILGIWALQLVVSPVWLRAFLFGPLEWLWRTLTYAARQPFVRRAARPAVPAAGTGTG